MKLIYLATLGSRGYGVAQEGSDTDKIGVAIEPPEAIIGLGGFEQSEEITEAGQTKIYGLRKFLRLALKGNTNPLEVLFAPSEIQLEPYTSGLLSLRNAIISKNCLRAYSGYMYDQIERLKGNRGQRGVNRPLLVEKYGYDTKYAYHIIRLGMMGLTLGRVGRIYIPLSDPEREVLMEIREGKWSLEQVLKTATLQKEGIDAYLKSPSLPDSPDFDWVQRWMMQTYRRELA